jgi:hypothetical protein
MTALSPEGVLQLARKPRCPRCDLNKTYGAALCHRCRNLLPAHMRENLESIPAHDTNLVLRSLRAAASYFNQHFQSVRKFGGGRRR